MLKWSRIWWPFQLKYYGSLGHPWSSSGIVLVWCNWYRPVIILQTNSLIQICRVHLQTRLPGKRIIWMTLSSHWLIKMVHKVFWVKKMSSGKIWLWRTCECRNFHGLNLAGWMKPGPYKCSLYGSTMRFRLTVWLWPHSPQPGLRSLIFDLWPPRMVTSALPLTSTSQPLATYQQCFVCIVIWLT